MNSTSRYSVTTALFVQVLSLLSGRAADFRSYARVTEILDADCGGGAASDQRQMLSANFSGGRSSLRYADQFLENHVLTTTGPLQTASAQRRSAGFALGDSDCLPPVDREETRSLPQGQDETLLAFPEPTWNSNTGDDAEAERLAIPFEGLMTANKLSADTTVHVEVSSSHSAEIVDVQHLSDFAAPLHQNGTHDSGEPRPKTMLWPYRVEDSPKKYLEWLLKDPINLVTRPFFWKGEQWAKFGIGLGVSGALLPADLEVRDWVQRNRSESVTSVLDEIRKYFTGDTLELAGVGIFASGLIFRNEKLADTGFLATESVFYSLQIAGVLKDLTNRERPKSAKDQYEFNGPRGQTRHSSSSFVSGEVMGAFAFAGSVSELWEEWWISVPLYLAASGVALHRLDHDAHWLTDVVVAGGLGHAIGKTMVRLHYRKDKGALQPFVTEDGFGLLVSVNF